jgi:hypothetical protein
MELTAFCSLIAKWIRASRLNASHDTAWAEAAGLGIGERDLGAKVRDEYSAMGQTKFAPITLITKATFMMLNSAKKRSA